MLAIPRAGLGVGGFGWSAAGCVDALLLVGTGAASARGSLASR
ncbi:hypothetical protein DB30_07798 [Enhygromyxa salina]|uniref:Uncharacterized protein n=1 Tax=Enhygromyxa salina TaxID=215803 RepID=A0A0C2A5X7_9BACT|nr:hypothetical protein DB30_07798 [Enhygromyxa salina]